MSVQIAGLACEFTPAPSDADDSITIWFPEKGTCVHNIDNFPTCRRTKHVKSPRMGLFMTGRMASGFKTSLETLARHRSILKSVDGPP